MGRAQTLAELAEAALRGLWPRDSNVGEARYAGDRQSLISTE